MRSLTNRVRDPRQDRRDQRIVGNWPGRFGRLSGFDQRGGPRIHPANIRENANGRDDGRAGKPNHHDFQMRSTIGAVHGMAAHMPSRSFNRLVAGFTQKVHSNSQNVGTRFLP